MLKINKIDDSNSQLLEFDPTNNKILNIKDTYSKLGILVDSETWTGLSTGKYYLVEQKFRKLEAQYKNSKYPDFADNLRFYDISTLAAESIDKILTHSGILEKILSKSN